MNKKIILLLILSLLLISCKFKVESVKSESVEEAYKASWPSIPQVKIVGNGISLSIANDDSTLYMRLLVDDYFMQRQITAMGVKILPNDNNAKLVMDSLQYSFVGLDYKYQKGVAPKLDGKGEIIETKNRYRNDVLGSYLFTPKNQLVSFVKIPLNSSTYIEPLELKLIIPKMNDTQEVYEDPKADALIRHEQVSSIAKSNSHIFEYMEYEISVKLTP